MHKTPSAKSIGISIIVPAYRAEKFIFNNLCELHKILEKYKIKFEIICVIDGLEDKTLVQAQKAGKNYKEIKIYAYKNNMGKGYALRYGFSRASGNVIGFIDAGHDLRYEDILTFFEIMKEENRKQIANTDFGYYYPYKFTIPYLDMLGAENDFSEDYVERGRM